MLRVCLAWQIPTARRMDLGIFYGFWWPSMPPRGRRAGPSTNGEWRAGSGMAAARGMSIFTRTARTLFAAPAARGVAAARRAERGICIATRVRRRQKASTWRESNGIGWKERHGHSLCLNQICLFYYHSSRYIIVIKSTVNGEQRVNRAYGGRRRHGITPAAAWRRQRTA